MQSPGRRGVRMLSETGLSEAEIAAVKDDADKYKALVGGGHPKWEQMMTLYDRAFRGCTDVE